MIPATGNRTRRREYTGKLINRHSRLAYFSATFFGFFGRESIGMTRLVVFFNLRSSFIRTRRFLAAVVRGRIGHLPEGYFRKSIRYIQMGRAASLGIAQDSCVFASLR